MIKPCVIYGIYHKDILGYVGITTNLERRKNRHLNPVFRKPRNVDIWISSVGGDVYFKVLEELPAGFHKASRVEFKWKRNLKPIIMD